MAGDPKKPAITIAKTFCAAQVSALNSEGQAREAILEALARSDCVVRVAKRQIQSSKTRLIFTITSPFGNDQWNIENGSKIMLFDELTFQKEAPTKDGEGRGQWTALVLEHTPTGILAQGLNIMHPTDMQPYDNLIVRGVKVTVIDEDRMDVILRSALRAVHAAFRFEFGLLQAEELKDKPEAQLRVPLSRLLIQHDDIDLASWSGPPIRLINPGPITYQDEWRLEDSHKTAFNTILAGHGGITGIRGPPGTGKTTLIAKCVAMALTQCELQGSIVLCAQSNQAAHVVLEKCFSEFSTFGLDASEEVVLVESNAGAQRRKESHRTLPTGLEASSLEERLLLLAHSKPIQYASYIRHIGMVRRGESLKKDEGDSLKEAEANLKQELREKKRVFICTLAVAGSGFFLWTMKAGKKFNCKMLFVDEASQVPMPYF